MSFENFKWNFPGSTDTPSRIAPRVMILVFISIVLLAPVGCDTSSRHRPFGYLRLGTIDSLVSPETELSDVRLLLRRDRGGFYVMSLMCTSDLSPLRRTVKDGKTVYVSDYSKSIYSLSGEVLSGPAVASLPFYRLQYAAGEIGGPLDTLYVRVGDRVPSDWRLPLPGVK